MQFAPLFHDHAVLQRNIAIPVWGMAGPTEIVTVSLAGQSARVTSGPDGRWLVRLQPLTAGGPYELKAESPSGAASAHDVLIGDVWICSGQSNMEWKLANSERADQPTPPPDLPQIRVLSVTNPARLGHHQEEVLGTWSVGTSKALLDFSGVGTWFGRELHRELGVPIGLICTAWGGTRVQAWISRESLMQDPAGREEIATYEKELYSAEEKTEDKYGSFQDWELRGASKFDTGNAGLERGWASTGWDDTAWPTMPVPSRWQDHNHPGSGVFWFRHTVTVPPEWIGRDLELHLGQIDKHDDTWVNGERVGGLSWETGSNVWCTLRVYPVPAHLVGADGRLVIAVRARSHIYNGGLFGPKKEIYVVPAATPTAAPLSLAGNWHYAIEQNWGMVVPPTATWTAENPNSPYMLFDCRVTPLLPYAIRGVIWYQGESNAFEAELYRRLMPLLIRDWRRAWSQGDFPFLQVQLANYMSPSTDPGPSDWAELREAQLSALSEPNTGLAVAIDVGEELDIHPRDKRSVGLRLARWALADFYGRGGMPSGPLFSHASHEAGGRIRLHFRHGTGLRTTDGQALRQVAVAGRDRSFVWAESAIEGATLVAWHPTISQPVAVRYAWAHNPEGCNLTNAEGLPASPFRTDNWEL